MFGNMLFYKIVKKGNGFFLLFELLLLCRVVLAFLDYFLY